VKWRLTFYNERSSLLACYDVEAGVPDEAVRLGWQALFAEHPATPPGGRLGLFKRAELAGGQHISGWVLHQLAQVDPRRPPRMTPAEAPAAEAGVLH
jgi:hypothetical protein